MPCSRLFSEDRPLTNRGFGLTPCPPARSPRTDGPLRHPAAGRLSHCNGGEGEKGGGGWAPGPLLGRLLFG